MSRPFISFRPGSSCRSNGAWRFWIGCAHRRLIVEDDYISEFRMKAARWSIAGARPHGRVIYIGNLLQTLFPALRLPTSCARPLVRPFLAAKWISDRFSSMIPQEALRNSCQRQFERYLRRAGNRNAARRRALIEALRRSSENASKSPAKTPRSPAGLAERCPAAGPGSADHARRAGRRRPLPDPSVLREPARSLRSSFRLCLPDGSGDPDWNPQACGGHVAHPVNPFAVSRMRCEQGRGGVASPLDQPQ